MKTHTRSPSEDLAPAVATWSVFLQEKYGKLIRFMRERNQGLVLGVRQAATILIGWWGKASQRRWRKYGSKPHKHTGKQYSKWKEWVQKTLGQSWGTVYLTFFFLKRLLGASHLVPLQLCPPAQAESPAVKVTRMDWVRGDWEIREV
jgi:hypothetical protein